MDYELLDSGQENGQGEKLECFGDYVLRRPDPEVLWAKLKPEIWKDADAHFVRSGEKGSWKKKESLLEEWTLELEGLKFHAHLGAFKHVGLFPEQMSNWTWMTQKAGGKNIKVLNLFAYTGAASCILAKAGAEVTHVDGAKSALDWARKNAEANGISNIRFIEDDVRKFVEREIKRGVRYDAVLMDPPVYGKGSKKEQWHIESDLLPLLERCKKLLSDNPVFFVVSGYASEYSHIAYNNALTTIFPDVRVESGELAIKEKESQRLLPAGIFARTNFEKK